MMDVKKMAFLAAIIGLLAVSGLILAACDNGSTDSGSGGGGGTVPSELVGKWSSQRNDFNGDYLWFEFTANSLIRNNTTYQPLVIEGRKISYTNTGNLTIFWENYTLDGVELTTSGGEIGSSTFYKVPN
jgi:hypothetical protein